MHDERPTGLTKQYIKFGAEAEVLGERGNVAAKRHDGGPKVAEVSPEVVQAQQDRLKQVKLAANQLDELVRNASRGTFDRQIAKGIVPKQALEGTQGLTKEDFLDVIIQFQNVQSNRHDVLVAKAAKDLEKLLPDATEQQAEQFLQGLMHRPSAVSAGKQESGAIEPEETAKQALRQAMADLPERRRGDLVDTYLQNLENSRRLTGE